MQGIELAPVVIASMIVGYMLNDFVRYVRENKETDVFVITKEQLEELSRIIDRDKEEKKMIKQAHIIDDYEQEGILTPNAETLDVVISKHGDKLAIPYEVLASYVEEYKQTNKNI